jgi:putative flippase GtrA
MAGGRQFIVFVSIGLLCAAIDVGVMQTLINRDLDPLFAASCGFVLGLIANFTLHMHVTFQVRLRREYLLRFLGVVLLNYLVTLAFVGVSVAMVDSALPGKILSLPVIAVVGFCMSKFWVFK